MTTRSTTLNTTSLKLTTAPRIATATITTTVDSSNSGRVGQVHFFSSTWTSPTKLRVPEINCPSLFTGLEGRHRGWQGRRDLNPQHPVLETGALPIELLPYPNSAYLTSRCTVCLRSKRQNFFSSSRSPPFRLLRVEVYDRRLQSVQANVMISRGMLLSCLSQHPARPRVAPRPNPGAVRIPYLMISVTRPAPTVRPPSRMAKRIVFSIAIGVMRLTSKLMLSPGMTMSTPAGSVMSPVTSVVRK